MKGVEMMLANLLGIKPEQMREQINQALELMKSGAQAAAKIQSDLERIKTHLGITDIEEGTLNGGRTISTSRNSSNNHRVEL